MTDAELDLIQAAITWAEDNYCNRSVSVTYDALRSAIETVRAERYPESKRQAYQDALVAHIRAQHELSRAREGVPTGLSEVLYARAEKQVEAEMKARGDL